MPAIKVLRSLLTGASAVTALVPATRITTPQRPQGDTALPALVLRHISRVVDPAVGAAMQARYSRTRVQVTALAADYPTLAALCAAVDAAVTYKAGTFAGVTVTTIERDLIGPDLVDDDTAHYYRHLDFLVWHLDP